MALNTTALVRESCLRLIKLEQLRVEDRSHFLAYSARVMRSVVVELRYFVGLEMEEIAQALGVGKRTVERDREKARSFLYAGLE